MPIGSVTEIACSSEIPPIGLAIQSMISVTKKNEIVELINIAIIILKICFRNSFK